MTDDMKPRKLNILVLFAGAGLATRGLLDAGHSCTDVEIDPAKSHLSKLLNPEAKHIVSDVRELDSEYIASFDAVWASPPCQGHSEQNHGTADTSGKDLLWWSLTLTNKVLWVENVLNSTYATWGEFYNAAQFERVPRQRRRRMIGGHFRMPYQYRGFKYDYPEWDSVASPAPLASELHHGGMASNPKNERRKFSRWHIRRMGRKPTLPDMAYRMGVSIPWQWYQQPASLLSTVLGNGVPVYMARAFGEAYSKPVRVIPMRQMELFAAV